MIFMTMKPKTVVKTENGQWASKKQGEKQWRVFIPLSKIVQM